MPATNKETDLVMIPLRMALWERDHGRPTVAGGDPSLGCRKPIHLDPADRAPRSRKSCPRSGPSATPAITPSWRQSTASTRPNASTPGLPRRPVQDDRGRRIRDRRLGRRVQQPTPASTLGNVPPIEFEQAHYATLNREPQPAPGAAGLGRPGQPSRHQCAPAARAEPTSAKMPLNNNPHPPKPGPAVGRFPTGSRPRTQATLDLNSSLPAGPRSWG